MRMDKQLSLSALSDELSQVRTKKREFLAEIDRIVPWEKWISIIKPYYSKESAATSPTIWNGCLESISYRKGYKNKLQK